MSTSIVQDDPLAGAGSTAPVRRGAAEQLWLEGFRVLAAALASVWCVKLAPGHILYAAAAAAALCVMIGLHTRVASSLLALLLAASPYALDPWHAREAPVVAFVAAWLALLPTGRLFALDARRRWKLVESTTLMPQLFTVQLVLLYADSASSLAGSRWLAIQPASLLAAAIPAALFLARSGPLLALPVAMQLAFHGYVAIHGGHYLSNALLASTGAVLLRTSAATAAPLRDAETKPAVIADARAALAIAWTGLVLIRLLTPMLHLSSAREVVAIVLHDMGWLGLLHGAI